MTLQKSYIQILCLSALFHSSIFAMRTTGVKVPTVPSSWMAKGFSYGVTPEGEAVQMPQATVNPEAANRVQAEWMQDQLLAQPRYSMQDVINPISVRQPLYVEQSRYDSSMYQPEQKSSKLAGRGDSQSGMFRPTAPRLISRGQYYDDKDQQGWSAGKKTAGGIGAVGLIGSVGYMASRDQRPLNEKLEDSVNKGDAHEVKQLLAQGTKPDNMNKLLHTAVRQNDSEIVKILLDAGADVNAITSSTLPILHKALLQPVNSSAMVKILVEAGADVNTNIVGTTPLDMAYKGGAADSVKILEKYGAKRSEKRKWSRENIGVVDLAGPYFSDTPGKQQDKQKCEKEYVSEIKHEHKSRLSNRPIAKGYYSALDSTFRK